MMKRILLVGAVLVLSACGSTEKSSDDSERSGGDTITVDREEDSSAGDTARETPAREPEKRVTPAQTTNALNEAFKSGNDENLQRIASQSLAQNPTDTKALNALGILNYKKNRYMAAMYYFNRALQHNPNMSDVHTNIGLTQLKLDQQREAIRSFRKAVELNSGDGTAAANLGSLYVNEGDYAKAAVALDRAIKSGIKDSKVYNNYGIALVGAGKYPEAKDIYKEAIRLDRNNRDALFNSAILMIDHLNDQSGGLEAINQLRFLGLADGMRDRINALENKAKAGSNSK